MSTQTQTQAAIASNQNGGVTTTDTGKDWANTDAVRHTKEDALSEREFERLAKATYSLDGDYFERESRLVLFLAGRLGMRAGEIAHMKKEWVDWDNQRICIPTYQECTDGRNGGICGHCKSAAKQMATTRTENALAEDGIDPDSVDYTTSEFSEYYVDPARFFGQMWSPKTKNASRDIPYGEASKRAAFAIEEYFQHYDQFEASRNVVNRRVERVANQCDEIDADDVYPHALRSTAASYYADRGLSARDLKSLFGWAQFSTALAYIEESPARLEDSLQQMRR
jgi:integrase